MADYTYLTTTGLIVPDTSTLLSEVQDEYRAALGADIVVTSNTPQGVLIATEVTARANVLGNNAQVANQINPNLAGGVFLDAIWALTGGQRLASTCSVVPGVALIGLPGVVIPAGSQASIADGTLFESVSGVVLDTSGNGTVDFQAVDPGPITVNVGALNQIVTGVLGWDSVSNATAATLGRNQESDLASRQRRKNTLSLQNVALPAAITSALYDTNNVKSLTFRENVTATTLTIDGVTLVPKSIYVCVDGGTDEDVAATLLANKSLGCDWNGSVAVNVVDATSGQTYPVKFDRPTGVDVQVKVTVRNQNAIQDVPESVRDAVMAYVDGDIDGEAGFTVGNSVSPFEIGGAVMQQVQGLYVKRVEISLLSPTAWGTDEIPIAVNQKAQLLRANIQVVIE